MSDPHKVLVRHRVEAHPEQVWAVVTDLDRAPEHLSQVTELHRITNGPYAIGTTWRETRRMMGSSETQEPTVIENDPQRRTVTEARDGRTRYRTALSLAPLDGGAATELVLHFSADITDPNRLQRLALRVIGPLGQKLTEKSLRTEVEDIARAAEALPA